MSNYDATLFICWAFSDLKNQFIYMYLSEFVVRHTPTSLLSKYRSNSFADRMKPIISEKLKLVVTKVSFVVYLLKPYFLSQILEIIIGH